METKLFDYTLPKEKIAQTPMHPRENAKMLVLDRLNGSVTDARVRDMVTLLRPGDVLVRNVSKVFNARLHAWKTVEEARARIVQPAFEILVMKCVADIEVSGDSFPRSQWEVLVHPLKKLHVQDDVYLGVLENEFFGGDVVATLMQKHADGSALMQFNIERDSVFALCEKWGDIPTPPYIEQLGKEDDAYQCVYARDIGSCAAPTAGFHFSDMLLSLLENHGVICVDVVLHVGLGTFKPIQNETIETHVMHSEWISLSQETIDVIENAKSRGNRVIAIGTTSARVLEGVVQTCGSLMPYEGDINIYITPGFVFRVIDGLLTNFHLPKSTLLVLVSAFAGREKVLDAYKYALINDYRFYSFGDAMLIV